MQTVTLLPSARLTIGSNNILLENNTHEIHEYTLSGAGSSENV